MVKSATEHVWHSPLDGSTIGPVSLTTPGGVNSFVDRARSAFPEWSSRTIESRGRIIRKAAQLLEQHAEELAQLVRRETGKPSQASLGEVAGAVEMGYLVASHGRHESGALLPSAIPGRHVRVQRVPRGVAALIVTYNAPLPNFAWKSFPALVAGNTAILKPSPANPISAIRFAELLYEAGVPHDAFQVMHGGGDTAELLIKAGVELVSFTGSHQTGLKVMAAASQTLAKTVIELGGANPLIVCDDADLEAAAEAVIDSAFSNAGQRCSSASRVIIQESVYSQFKNILFTKATRVSWGTSPDVLVSTLVNKESVSTFEAYLAEVEASGGQVNRVGELVGMGEKACLAQPAIIEGLGVDNPLGIAEFFGPATRLFSFSHDAEAAFIANSSDYGLTAAVWSQDIARAERLVSRIKAGVININGPTHGAEVNMPFGGMKHSGNGSRDAGINAIDQYSDVQVISTFFGP